MNKPTVDELAKLKLISQQIAIDELANLTLISQQIAILINDMNTPKPDVKILVAKKREIDNLFLNHVKELDIVNLFKPAFWTPNSNIHSKFSLTGESSSAVGPVKTADVVVVEAPKKEKNKNKNKTVPPPAIDSSLANPSDIKELSPQEKEANEIAERVATAKADLKKKGRRIKNV